jgi:hypothetical protein
MMPYRIVHDPKEGYFVVTIDSGKVHSKHGLDYETACRQMRALYRASGKEAKMHAGAFIPFIKSLPSRLRGFFSREGTRLNYRPQDRELLAKLGNQTINHITIMREPIAGLLEKVMNAISLGKLDEIKRDKNYTDFYHLFMVLTLANGAIIKVEKNQTIELKQLGQTPQGKETIDIVPIRQTTLREFLDKGQRMMGTDKYFTYDAKNNNCQVYVYSLLEANSELNNERAHFVMQDVSELPSFTQTIGRAITDLAHRADILVSGAGLRQKKKKKKQKY